MRVAGVEVVAVVAAEFDADLAAAVAVDRCRHGQTPNPSHYDLRCLFPPSRLPNSPTTI